LSRDGCEGVVVDAIVMGIIKVELKRSFLPLFYIMYSSTRGWNYPYIICIIKIQNYVLLY